MDRMVNIFMTLNINQKTNKSINFDFSGGYGQQQPGGMNGEF